MHMIENGIDFSALTSRKIRTKEGNNLGAISAQPIVGTVARLHRQKGLTYFVKAAKELSKTYPNVKVMIVGGGPQRHKLERLNKSLGLLDTLQFMGERKDAVRLLSTFDVFVLPSLWEGLPYALIEAGALGLAVVASDIDGNREIIRDGETGVLVPPRDSDALAASIIRLLSDEDTRNRIGENLKESIVPRYTLARMVQHTQELYLRSFEKSNAAK